MKYKYVLFDLDGTLTDPKDGITRCVQYALRSFGIEEECNRLIPFIGPPLKEMFVETYGVDGDAAVAKYRERFSVTGKFENSVYPGIPELLRDLHTAGVRVALATSKPGIYSQQILEHFGIDGSFDVVVGSELDGSRTDKAEVIAEALHRLGEPEHSLTVMVGDRMHDVVGAKKNSLRCIGVRYGFAAEGELESAGADEIAGSVEQLRGLLL